MMGGKEEWGRRVLAVVGAAAVAHVEGCSLGELVGVLWGCVKAGLKQEVFIAEVVVARALSGAGNLSFSARIRGGRIVGSLERCSHSSSMQSWSGV